MPLCLFACAPEWEAPLIGELARVFPAGEHTLRSPGWVQSHLDDSDDHRSVSVALSSQCLPHPVPVSAPSISTWAKTVGPMLIDAMQGCDGPWRLHVWCVDYPGAPVIMTRCKLVEEGLIEHLKEKRRKLFRSRTVDPAAPWIDGEWLVQLALETPTLGWLSVVRAEERHRMRRVISRLPGGRVEVPEDSKPPSSAWRKLAEAEIHLGRAIGRGERCVDLGGSPGGWSWVALQRGAQVTTVDRSPLRDDLMKQRRLTFVRGDAFRFEPVSPVDWLLCDVIAFPQRTLELLDHWLSRRLCRRFCVTVKFRGRDDDAVLEDFKAMLERHGAEYLLRKLGSNRNEVTAMGELPAEP